MRAWVSTPPVAALFKEGKAFGFGWDWDCWWWFEDGWLEFKPHLGEAAVVEEAEEFKLLPWRLLNLEPVCRLETWFGIGLGDELLELLFGFNLEPEPAEPREDLCLKEDAISEDDAYWMPGLICPFFCSISEQFLILAEQSNRDREEDEWEREIAERWWWDRILNSILLSLQPYIRKYQIKMAKGKGKDSQDKSKDNPKSKTKSSSDASENLSAALGGLLDPSSSSGTSLSTASPLHLVQNALDMLDYRSTIELSTRVSIPSRIHVSFIFQPTHAIFSLFLFFITGSPFSTLSFYHFSPLQSQKHSSWEARSILFGRRRRWESSRSWWNYSHCEFESRFSRDSHNWFYILVYWLLFSLTVVTTASSQTSPGSWSCFAPFHLTS